MSGFHGRSGGGGRLRRAFTLIELMVVVAIIALLVAILLPSLSAARAHAKTVACSANLHSVGLAVSNYLYGSRGTYPASYLYPSDKEGSWTVAAQTDDHTYGYLHWSYFMYDSGQVGEKAFQCPQMTNGGAPRTNPGLNANDWEPGQIDQFDQKLANELTDKQAPRMAYTANAAIMPRNKFTTALSGGLRSNIFVKDGQVKRPGGTILAAEFLDNWKAVSIDTGNGILSKSHRPINPFFHQGSNFNEYASPKNTPGFIYGSLEDQHTYGLLKTAEVRDKTNILDYTSTTMQINALGRHHPNPNTIYARVYGGLANFLFADTHAESLSILDTMTRRMWGDAYYSLEGENRILNMTSLEEQR